MSIQIVHIEDDSALRNILKITVRTADPQIQILQYADGESALPYIEQNWRSINLFILDIRLPGNLNGLQIAKKIRDLGSTAHIILTSAFSSPISSILTGLDAEYLPKPLHILELTQKLLTYQLEKADQPPSEPNG